MAPTNDPSPLPTPAAPVPGAAPAITRQVDPPNIESAFENLDTFLTPRPQFYVRSHFPTPPIDPATWRLRIEGHVEHPCEIGLAELLALPTEQRTVTLECAGNGRAFLVPPADGVQWTLGAVGNASWTGVPLAALLAKAGVKPGAVEVMFEGADRGRPAEKSAPPEEIHYAHSVPMHKVGDVLLAHQINGEPLPPRHGFPLRALVGGWYGMASVKWVQRIVVLDEPFRGYFRTVDYAYWARQAGAPVRVPIEAMRCKAQIARPAMHEAVPRNTLFTVTGAAWTGDTDVVRVELSTDGGASFAEARLLGEPVRHAWRLWAFNWHTPAQPGSVTLIARATDAQGRTQPAERTLGHGSYIINHLLPVACNII